MFKDGAHMDEPVTYDAYLEIERGGRCIAWILDLPGCFAYGTSEREALEALTAAIPPYYAWLKQHDEYTPDVRGPWRVAPRETFRDYSVGDGVVGPCFTPEAQPVDDEELDWGLALLGWSHEDLLALVRGLPPAALDADPFANRWTVRAILTHVARTQLWYATHLDATPAPVGSGPVGGDPIQLLQQVHSAVVARLRNASDEQRTTVFEHAGERWSLRKVLRRSVWHLRDHTAHLQQTLAALGPAR
jgi:uncharacterized damage-inducible protein DinB/predicted RNase H-like HicB family nuclease